MNEPVAENGTDDPLTEQRKERALLFWVERNRGYSCRRCKDEMERGRERCGYCALDFRPILEQLA